MKKKLFLSVAILAAMAVGVVGMSAFEAHVINVTAKIQNALAVNTEPLQFNTVFPQEVLHKDLNIGLSQSFIDEGRVDSVSYRLVQKLEEVVGTGYDGATEDVSGLSGDIQGNYYPSLCGYLSKHLKDVNETGVSVDAFHNGRTWTGEHVMYDAIASGDLNKDDVNDTWDIDFAAPCFEDQCAQDWATFVKRINADANAEDFILPQSLMGEKLSCNLWVEVTGIGEYVAPAPRPYQEGDVIKPIFECWEDDLSNEGMYIANFGYSNQTTDIIALPHGATNKVNAGYDGVQPSVFNAGRTAYQPGPYAFSISNWDGANVVWTLLGRTSTASLGGPKCNPVD